MLDLKELAFTAEEDLYYNMAREYGVDAERSKQFAKSIVEANDRILAEKLARAPEVEAEQPNGPWGVGGWVRLNGVSVRNPHTARLVCIEKMEKPE